MKIEIHRSKERGYAKYSWLETWHSFSFANYFNPKRMNFGTLRVLNEDYIKPSSGFPEHEHDNMEIVTIVLDGQLEHRDSTGGYGVLKPGEIQRMSAGSGVTHSEFNPSDTESTHLLQIWIDTKEQNIDPSYEQKPYKLIKNKFVPIVANNNGVVKINQDARFLLGDLSYDAIVEHNIENPENGMFVFVIDGSIEIKEHILSGGDAAGITNAKNIEIKSLKKSNLLIIEMPMG